MYVIQGFLLHPFIQYGIVKYEVSDYFFVKIFDAFSDDFNINMYLHVFQ